ncbi:MAG: substrate-binding domain-containing protein, partial [Hyphomicrobiales bacterium]|nr:substrate-binding domain-containing protein [Hyphomicrobiales bacterium]
GAKAATARIGMLDINKDNISVDVLRDTGFLTGFGIKVPNGKVLGSEKSKRVVGHETSNANEEGGQKAMETLLAKDPNINVVYTINEPAAAGAYQALKKAGKDKGVLVVSVDGGCPGVQNVAKGVIGATSQQYPLLMASKGIDAIATYAKTGKKPTASKGLTFFNTGVNLVTDHPVAGVPSIDSKQGLAKCWG